MNKFCAVLLMVTSITTLLTEVNGECHFAPITIVNIGMKQLRKCVYEDLEYEVGSTFKTTDCYECSCTESGFFCCGFQIHASVVDVPTGYKMVHYGCNFKIEKIKDDEVEK